MEIEYWVRCGLDGGNCSNYVQTTEEEDAQLYAYAKEYKEKNGEEIDGYALTEYLENNMPATYDGIYKEVEEMVFDDMSHWEDPFEPNYDEEDEDYDEDEAYDEYRQSILDKYSYGFRIADGEYVAEDE